jgi:hypothetical protein
VTEELSHFWEWIAAGLATMWGGLLSWVGLSQVARISKVEETKAGSASVNVRFDQVLERIDAHQVDDREIHKEIANKLDAVNAQLSTTNIQLAGIVGELKGKGHIA